MDEDEFGVADRRQRTTDAVVSFRTTFDDGGTIFEQRGGLRDPIGGHSDHHPPDHTGTEQAVNSVLEHRPSA